MQLAEDLQWRISQMPDARLLHMLAEGRGEHGRAAVDLAATELARRGVNVPTSLYQPELESAVAPERISREQPKRTRTDKLKIIFFCCFVLVFSLWNLFDEGKLHYGLVIASAVIVIYEICERRIRRLRD